MAARADVIQVVVVYGHASAAVVPVITVISSVVIVPVESVIVIPVRSAMIVSVVSVAVIISVKPVTVVVTVISVAIVIPVITAMVVWTVIVESVVVTHANVCTSVVERVSLVSPETASAIAVPAVSAAIRYVNGRTREVEVCAVRVSCIDTEVPVACVPIERTIEVACCAEGAVLPVKQNIAEVKVTAVPICAIYIVSSGHSHQVVEVYLVGSVILRVGEIKLVCHLVCEEQSLAACLLVTHSLGAHANGENHYKGIYNPFHSRDVL